MRNFFSRGVQAIGYGLALCAGYAGGVRAAPSMVVEGPTVELPEFVVSGQAELPQPEPWRYTTTPGYEVLSTATDRATRRLLQQFQLFEAALKIVWPVERPARSRPAVLILCGRGKDFDRFDAVGRGAAPLGGRATRLLENGTQTIFVVDLATRYLSLPPMAAPGGAARPGPAAEGEDTDVADADVPAGDEDGIRVNGSQQLCREYVRHVLGRHQPRLPPWLEEGLAQLFMGMEVSRSSITFARLTPTLQLVEGDEGEFHSALRGRPLLPLGELFAMERDAPEATHAIGSIWAKQAQAFVHLGLYGGKGRYRTAFLRFATRAAAAPVSEQMFIECFGFDYRRMERELRLHVQVPRFEYFKFTAEPGRGLTVPAAPELRDATPDEVGRLLGDALALAGDDAQALRERRLAQARGARDPRVLAALGEAEIARGNAQRGHELLARAVAADVDRPEAYVALARHRLAETADPLDARTAAEILRLLFDARRLAPPDAGVYRTIATVWTRSAVTPSTANLEVLYEGLGHFPRDAVLACALAGLEERLGHLEEARRLVTLGLRTSTDDATRGQLEQMERALGGARRPVTP